MAEIGKQYDDSTWIIPSRCLIGRSSACQLRVECPETSGEHALLRWRSGVWELQDLHSRNGTYIDGRRLRPGGQIGLAEGARLGFGHPDQYTLFDVGPPRLHAVGIHPPYPTVHAADDLLLLPDPERIEAVVRLRDRRWWLERDDEVHPLTDGELVHTRGGTWRIHAPVLPALTRDSDDVAPRLAALALRFVIGADGTIDLLAFRGDTPIDLKARAHNNLLLALARVRLDDRALRSDECGWVDQDALLRQLGYDSNRLHVEIHRIRRQFVTAGFLDATNIIERSEGTRQLRIGISRLEIFGPARAPGVEMPTQEA